VSEPRYALEFTTSAARQARKLDPQIRTRVRAATEGLRYDPRPAGVKALVNSPGLLRIRVGDWRVIYRVEEARVVVVVVEVGHRREVYRET
jgi:mRNA interferase RelE/StbE